MKGKLTTIAIVAIVMAAATAGCELRPATEQPSPTETVTATATTARETPTGKNWIMVDAGKSRGPVNKLLFGSYVTSPGGGNGMLLPGKTEFDPEALRLTRELSPTIMRLGVLPIFEDALGAAADRREARCGWEDWHTNYYGLDEHMALLKTLGAPGQALVTVGYPFGLADGSDPKSCLVDRANLSQVVKRAMAWVAYANGSPKDQTVIGPDDQGFDWRTVGYWADRRVKNGHAAPYGIKYWEIGNEIYYEDNISAQQYASDFLVFYKELKRIDPNITVAASARLEPAKQEKWNVPLLSAIGSQVDALALHMYYPTVDKGDGLEKAVMASAVQADKDLAYTRELIAKHTKRPEKVALILGENGILYSGDYEDATLWNSLLAGLYDVDLIGAFVQRSADYHLALGIQHFLHADSDMADIMYNWSTGKRYLRPDYYALQMWTKHFGDTLLETNVRCDTFDVTQTYGNVEPLSGVPYLAAHASKSGNSRLYLLVINRNLTEDIETTISIQGFTPQTTGKAYTLNGPDIQATNEDGNHDAVITKATSISNISGEFTYTFPAHSVTALELERKQEV